MTRALSRRLALGVAILALAACGGGASSLPQGRLGSFGQAQSSPIQHVVIIVQENRSFDNFFARFPGANGATRGKMKVKQGSKYVDKWITLKPQSLVLGTDLQHCHKAFETDYDGGKMDGFNLEGKGACPTGMPAGALPYHYVKQSDIGPYWDIAQQWVLADAMFQSQGSGSFTAHQDLIRGGTCIQACGKPSKSTLSLVDNPTYWPWGCDNPNATVYTIDIQGQIAHDAKVHPCSNSFPNYSSGGYDTLATRLDSAGVTWKYYTPCFSSADQSGCSPSSDCDGGKSACDADLLDAFDVIYEVRHGSEWGSNVSWPETNIFSDISKGTLPAVSWVIPEDDANDHPGQACKCDTGPSWVASVVNAVGESKFWNSSVIVVLWDDWGGFYDHVAPRQYTGVQGGLGFRVPMLALSPYAVEGSSGQGGYVSHTQYEYGSILKYIEQNWNLSPVGTTDQRAASIGDIFNYSQSPRTFKSIGSKYSARYFIERPHTIQHGDPQ
jgi:phospholipase C